MHYKHHNKYKVRAYLQYLWNQTRKLHYLQGYISKKVICRKNLNIN